MTTLTLKAATSGRTDVCPRSSNAIGPERGGLQICDLTRSCNFFKFLSNDYTNSNTNPKTLTAGILTLTYPDDAFESFCAPAFCDFIRNYSPTDVCPLVTSFPKSYVVSFVITNMPEILCCK